GTCANRSSIASTPILPSMAATSPGLCWQYPLTFTPPPAPGGSTPPPAPGGSTPPPAPGGSFLLLARDERVVRVGVEERVDLLVPSERDPDHPAVAVRVLVDALGLVAELLVHCRHAPAHRREQVGHGLVRLDDAERLAPGERCPHRRQLDEDDVTERVLGEVGDADHPVVALETQPLVVLRVTEIVRKLHRSVLPSHPSIDRALDDARRYPAAADLDRDRCAGCRRAGRDVSEADVATERRRFRSARHRPGASSIVPHGLTMARHAGLV